MPEKRPGHTERDLIAEALRRAGPRGPLPDFDLEALSAPARSAWIRRVEHRRRRRRRLGFVAAASVALLALGLFFSGLLSPAIPVGTVVVRAGEIVAPEGDAEPGDGIEPGSKLWIGQRLVTAADPGEWLTVELRTGHRLRLDAGTELRIDSASQVELEAGRVYVEATSSGLRLLANRAEIEHIGTNYMVSLTRGRFGVWVRHGRVMVRKDHRQLAIDRGQELWEEDGELQVREQPPHGEAWSWTRRAAPPFESDGAELESFLRWIEAETGLEVRVDPALLLDDHGEPVRILGTIDDDSPKGALETVLAGAGLRHRLNGDRLWIEAADPHQSTLEQ